MHKSLVVKDNTEFPSKNYSKYRSQSKTNPFLNKLNQDAGYPQDVLSPHSTIILRNHKNYLDLNKQNLKNFFSDRLPPKEVDIYRQNFTIDPSRLFQIKKKQHQLKAETRSKLQQKLDPKCETGRLDPKKITQNFQYNDKNEEFKKRVLGSEGVRIVQPYETNNFLRGTTSYVRKYNQITKKQAYNSVFGPQTSAMTRKSMTARSNRQNSNITRPFTTIQDRKKFKSTSGSKQLQSQRKFSSLIQKIDGYRKNLDPQNRRGMREYVPPKQIDDTELIKTELITWIRDTTKSYKINSIQNNREHIRDVDDLQKIDDSFYKDLKKHKAKRLEHRSSYVQNIKLNNNCTARNSRRVIKDDKLELKSNDSLSEQSRHQSEQYSISSSSSSEEDVDPLNKHSPAFLLKKFIRLLVDALTQARFFGIENKENIYKAFWKNPQPYEKSGSYAFFKAVKKGQIEAVKGFLRADSDYVYERDHKGRSPLILATMNNHTNLIKFLLDCDVNVNKRCFSLKTALYYAIRNKNIAVVKKLLQKGALPWSTKSCRYNQLMQKIKCQQIQNLMKNARRIGILIQMQPNKIQKVNLWKNVKHKIVENEIVSYQ